MQSRMHPRYYLSQEIFAREQERIFRKVWLFAGLAALVPENQCFITRKVAGIPVVIQNFNGVLKAFENVCLHRSAPLQTGFTGKRPLVCAYHGWSYDVHGAVSGIPDQARYYRFEDEALLAMNLREFALKQVGGLLFINLAENPIPFESQFSPAFLELLESSAQAYDGEVLTTTRHARFNWKLVYENLRDANHVKYLHPASLATVADFPLSVASDVDLVRAPLSDKGTESMREVMRNFSTGGAEGAIDPIRQVPWLKKVNRWGDTDAYFNWLAYPNLHIACGNGGFSFAIEHHVPVAPDRTDVELYVFLAKKKSPIEDAHQVLLSNLHYGKRILDEDFGMLETVQATLHEGAPIPNQGAYETNSRMVERWYAELMEGDCAI